MCRFFVDNLETFISVSVPDILRRCLVIFFLVVTFWISRNFFILLYERTVR